MVVVVVVVVVAVVVVVIVVAVVAVVVVVIVAVVAVVVDVVVGGGGDVTILSIPIGLAIDSAIFIATVVTARGVAIVTAVCYCHYHCYCHCYYDYHDVVLLAQRLQLLLIITLFPDTPLPLNPKPLKFLPVV